MTLQYHTYLKNTYTHILSCLYLPWLIIKLISLLLFFTLLYSFIFVRFKFILKLIRLCINSNNITKMKETLKEPSKFNIFYFNHFIQQILEEKNIC